jgi:uncharacterized protein (TIGR03437 family)
VIRQLTDLDRLNVNSLCAFAFLFVLAPVVSQAQTAPQYTITTIAGQLSTTGGYTGDGGAASSATLNGPDDIIFDSSGNMYVSDSINNLIREISASGTISTYAGSCPSTPCAGAFAGDGSSATKASLNKPSGMTFDSSNNFYIADTDNFEVRKVAGGDISTFAGHNGAGASFSGNLGAATSAGLWNPSGVAVDSAGNVYIADPYNNVVRVVCQTQTPTACTNNAFIGGVVWAAGDINTFAGNNAVGAGYQGDGGIATGSLLNNPSAVLLDAQGNLYISDSGNSAIRKVAAATSIITTVAGDGTGIAGYSGDGGPATQAKLNNPMGLALDSSGNLYIADDKNCLIRMVNATTGIITTIAGVLPAAGQNNCGSGGNGGLATSAQLNDPTGVAVSGGKVYIADFGNNAVRLLTPAAEVPQISASGVVNDASYESPLVPGSIAAVFGDFFLTAGTSNTEVPLVTSLQNLSFQFGTNAAPLYYVSGTQVNLQVPWELAGQTSAALTPTLNGTAGASETVTVAPYAPAIFTLNSQGTGAGAILDSSYHLVGANNPATAGTTTILIYCTGLGAVSANQPATGAPASLSPNELAPTTTQVTVSIGGITEPASFAGLAPGFVGLYQVNALVPAGVASGSTVPVTITMGSVTSNTATIVVQ